MEVSVAEFAVNVPKELAAPTIEKLLGAAGLKADDVVKVRPVEAVVKSPVREAVVARPPKLRFGHRARGLRSTDYPDANGFA
jgi:hypothetical protein